MRIRFEDKMNRRYMMVCPDRSDAGFSAFRYRMILENRIKGIVSCRTGNLDGRLMLYYNTTGLAKVSEYLREHAADEAFLRRLLRELAAVTEELQRYLIESECILLGPEQLFVSAETGAFRFAVWFEDRNPFSENLLKLSEFLIPRLPNNNHTAAAIGYELYQTCLSGLVTAGTLRRIAESEFGRESTEPEVYSSMEEKTLSVSEDDIFTLRSRKKKRRSGNRKPFRETLMQTVKAFRAKIVLFLHSLTGKGQH